VCGRPPFGLDGSSPGSCPGCHAGRKGVKSTVLEVIPVLTRVCRRFKIEANGGAPSGSELVESLLWPLLVIGDLPASTSKLTRVGDDIVGGAEKSLASDILREANARDCGIL